VKIAGGQKWKHKTTNDEIVILKKDDPPVAYKYETYSVPNDYVNWVIRFADDKKEQYSAAEGYIIENYEPVVVGGKS
jgi:hypothetical protein